MSAILSAAHGGLPRGDLPGDADGDGHPHDYDYDGLMVPAAGLRPGRRMIAMMLLAAHPGRPKPAARKRHRSPRPRREPGPDAGRPARSGPWRAGAGR